MNVHIIDGVRFAFIVCGGCGVRHAMPLALYKGLKEGGAKGEGWFCPNGCHQHPDFESNASELQ